MNIFSGRIPIVTIPLSGLIENVDDFHLLFFSISSIQSYMYISNTFIMNAFPFYSNTSNWYISVVIFSFLF